MTNLDEKKNLEQSLKIIKSNALLSPVASPNASKLGKYITDGFEQLPIENMKITVQKADQNESFKNESTLVFDELTSISSQSNDDNIYLSSIYETFSNLDKKVEIFMKKEYFDTDFIKSILKLICEGSFADARNIILRELKLKDKNFIEAGYSLINNVVQSKDIQKELYKIKEEVAEVEECNLELKKEIFNLCKCYFNNEKKILKEKTEKYHENFKNINEIEKLKNEISKMKKSLKDLIENCKIENKNFTDDYYKNIKSINYYIDSINNEKLIYKKEGEKIAEINKLSNDFEFAKKEIDELKKENFSFTEAISKINESNIKLKKEYIKAVEAYKKACESSKRKTITIEKQKKIIDVLQNKVGGSASNTPLNDLKHKIEEIKKKLDEENNENIKQNIVEELIDYEKRMADFLSISR